MEFRMIDDIRTETKIMKFLTLKSFFFILAFVIIGVVFSSMVYDSLQIWFIVYNVAVGFVMSLPSTFNKDKRIYQSILIFIYSFKEHQSTYHSIEYECAEEDVIKQSSLMYKPLDKIQKGV